MCWGHQWWRNLACNNNSHNFACRQLVNDIHHHHLLLLLSLKVVLISWPVEGRRLSQPGDMCLYVIVSRSVYFCSCMLCVHICARMYIFVHMLCVHTCTRVVCTCLCWYRSWTCTVHQHSVTCLGRWVRRRQNDSNSLRNDSMTGTTQQVDDYND